MTSHTTDKALFSDTHTWAIKCSLCGFSFDKGQKTSCASCPLNYGSCNFEKCPHCGYDIPQGSHLWTFAVKTINKFKKAGRR